MSYKHSCVVDGDGKYIDYVLIVDDIVQYYMLQDTETLIDTPVPSGFLKPCWNGAEWTESASKEEIVATLPSIDELKADKKAEIATARWQAETGGIQFNGLTIVTDRESQSLINGAVTSTLLDPTYTARWKTVSGFVALDAPMIQAVATAVRNHVQACFNHEAALDATIEAITTTDVIKYAAILKTITWEVN